MSVSVDHNFACATNALIETRADTIIAALNGLSTEESLTSSRYHGRLDYSKIGLMGHSRGGDAVVRAVKKILAEPSLSATVQGHHGVFPGAHRLHRSERAGQPHVP